MHAMTLMGLAGGGIVGMGLRNGRLMLLTSAREVVPKALSNLGRHGA